MKIPVFVHFEVVDRAFELGQSGTQEDPRDNVDEHVPEDIEMLRTHPHDPPVSTPFEHTKGLDGANPDSHTGSQVE
mgnify:CR=1